MADLTSTNNAQSLISDRTRDFTGREWVFQQLETWRVAGQPSVFLLSGGPGTGKTALAARLVQMSDGMVPNPPYPHLGPRCLVYAHFCRARQDDTLNPLSFVTGLSLALANRYPDYAEALTHLGDQNITINAIQRVTSVEGGTVQNVVIQNLQIGNLPARIAFDRLIRGPLRELCSSPDFHETLWLLVDSLDEALTLDPDDNLVTLLTHALDMPEQVSWLMTGRQSIFGLPTLDLIRDAPNDANDVEKYVDRRLVSWPEPHRQATAELVKSRSAGNFLYARYVLDDLLTAPPGTIDIGKLQLPKDLPDIYRQYLQRQLTRNRERWEDRYRPLLGALAVAQGSGLTAAQLAGAMGLPRSRTDDVLRDCGPYLSGVAPEGPFRLYHQSFRDFLVGTDDTSFMVYSDEASAALAGYFMDQCAKQWTTCSDEYGLRYTPTHALEAARGADLPAATRTAWATRLVSLLKDLSYVVARMRLDDGNTRPLEQDYASTLITLTALPPGDREVLVAYANALRHESAVLREYPEGCYAQLYNRLYRGDDGAIDRALGASAGVPNRPWLRACYQLPSSDTALHRTLSGHTSGVSDVAITADGQLAISGAQDGTLRVWDLGSGENRYVLPADPHWVRAVTVTLDGRLAVSGGYDGMVKVWDLATRQNRSTFSAHVGSVTAVAVTPNGQCAVSGGEDGKVRVWDLTTEHDTWTFAGHSQSVWAIAVTADGRYAVSGGTDGKVSVWDLTTGKERWIFPGPDGPMNPVAVASTGLFAAAGGPGGMVQVWDLTTGEATRTLKGHNGGVRAVVLIRDGERLISNGTDDTLRCWDLSTGQLEWSLDGYSDMAWAVTPSGQHAVSGDARTGLVRAWTLPVGREPALMPSHHTSFARTVAVMADGQHAISGGKDGALQVWNLTAGHVEQILKGDSAPLTTVAVAGDGRIAVSGGRDGIVRAWNLATGLALGAWVHCKEEREEHVANDGSRRTTIRPGIVEGVAVTNDGTLAVSGGSDGMIRVWDLATRQLRWALRSTTGWIRAVAVTDDGRRAISGGDLGRLQVWDLTTGRLVQTHNYDGGTIWAVALTPDGQVAVSNSGGLNVLSIWDLETGHLCQAITGENNVAPGVAITEDGQLGISCGTLGMLRIWDLTSGSEITRYTWGFPLVSCAVSRKGEILAAVDERGDLLCFTFEMPRSSDPRSSDQ